MRFGLGTLRLSPDQFWAMTPLELHLAFEGWSQKYGSPETIERATLDGLMKAHPDKQPNLGAK